MAEPTEIAPALEHVADDVWHWRIDNAAIGGGISSSHAVRVELEDGRAGCVLVDPVRLDPHAMQQLPPVVAAVVLTARCHQRSAWRIRRDHDAPVWAPADADGFDEEPDHAYRAGDELPGGLVAIHTPGPEQAHYSLHLPAAGAVIVSDILRRTHDGTLEFVPFEYHEDPAQTVASAQRLAELDCSMLLLDHGAPITSGATAELVQLIERTSVPT